jgi:hypothetical protein
LNVNDGISHQRRVKTKKNLFHSDIETLNDEAGTYGEAEVPGILGFRLNTGEVHPLAAVLQDLDDILDFQAFHLGVRLLGQAGVLEHYRNDRRLAGVVDEKKEGR